MAHLPRTKLSIIGLALTITAAACAPQPGGQGSQAPRSGVDAQRGPKRLVAAIMAEPPALHRALIPPGYIIQTGDVVDTIGNIGLTIVDDKSVRHPVLAQPVPSI